MSNPNFPLPLGPLAAGPLIGEQGEVDVFIWAQAKTSSPLTLRIFWPNLPFTGTWTLTPRADEFYCVVFHATGLTQPGTYEYELSTDSGRTQRFKLRRPPRKDGKRLRIIYGSCIQNPNEAEIILKRMADENADLLMLIGDNSYFYPGNDGDRNDWDSEPLMMDVHLRWRRAAGMRELCGNTPTLAIWDDHDYGRDDIGGSHNEHRAEALHCFKRMWAQRDYGIPGTRGIFSSVRYGPAQIFLLDVRFFREGGNVIAPGQMQWLKDSLRASDAPVKLIVSGSQFLPNAAVARGWECWQRDGNDQQRKLLEFLAENISGAVFITGDVHLGQLLFTRGFDRADGRQGGDVWELTSSPLVGPTYHNPIMQGAERVFDPCMIREVPVSNYGMIDINLERERKEISLELKSVVSSLFRVEVDLERLRHRPKKKIRAFGSGADHRKAFFFRGDRFVEYDIATRTVISGPLPIKSRWPDFKGEFDTGTEWPVSRTYFFKGNGYRLWGSTSERVSERTYISDSFHWPIEFQTGIDAILLWSDGHAYAFKGRNYIKFNMSNRATVGNFPQPIAKWWKGVWEGGIDAVFQGPNGKLHFFRGDEYILYDIHNDQREGDPEPIAAHWPGLSF